ncbi:hypothetical protein [Bradyrhizobium sp. 170]|uniref:hypothetical protein n=1 Tax=Bradyrhizobium sp. 170 TaxID=2782641 RepID=UPI001FFE883A|nr:hypothetical protein [Bradyrhizobium sp. 170]UPK06025.1 hypothetical protein IVB05_11070 [Bradyrhizobium sp. 170]
MLPGFRFLFTAIVLSMSVLVFGLGAAALLRASHEEFANLPSRRVMAEPMFARRNDGPPPTLALLRIDPPVAEKPAENVPAAAIPQATPDIPAPAEQTPDAAAEKLAAESPAEPVQVEAAKPETPEAIAEIPAAPAPAAGTEAPVANSEVKLAAIPETPEPAAATPPATATDTYSFEGNLAATQIATLGGPAVIVDEKAAANAAEAKTTEAKPDHSAVKKRAAERAQERRRIAVRRARLAREAALAQQQLQANPFAQFPLARTTR